MARKVRKMANQPKMYQVSGAGIHVTYSTTSLQGQPLFNYHDAFQVKNFTGNQIQTVDSILGKLVTVYLHQTIDAGSTTFTLLVPHVNLPAASNVANITTEGITTLHKFSIIPIQGQTELY